MLLKLELLQAQADAPASSQDMSEADRRAALELLNAPDLLGRIVADFAACGVVGEETNKLVGYLAAVSRKLDTPLAVVIQSSSAAGKSSLMDAVLAFVPEEERIKYSEMTGQSLFYMGETNLKHKVLAICEEEGASRAAYALKLLQSDGELTIASTGKDAETGNLVTQEYRVEGPVSVMLIYVRLYVEWLEATGRTEQTVKGRAVRLERFVGWCEVRGLSQPEEITRAVLEAYQRYLYLYRKKDGKPLSIRTQETMLTPLRGWCKWLARERYVQYNAASELVLPRAPKLLPRVVLSVVQVERLMAQPDVSGNTGARDRAMLEVLYSTGMRRMELMNLTVSEIDLEGRTVMIRQGKGRRDRYIPMGERACYWVQRYLDEVRPHLVVREAWTLFLTDYGEAYSGNRLTDLVKRYMELAGIGNGACHALRHACATHMLENGADVRFIQALLGHADLSSTQIYTQVAIGKLKEIHAATHPAKLTASLLAAIDAEADEDAQ
ncbi:site-specific tyrosine recombinase XerC [Caballeronia zhejiangensis]|uniref:site-specific tyrosine recombinase XerC n=1 Tax=Caballeronia zhejiangensis TaxID=871203 RepID=UPI0030C6A957